MKILIFILSIITVSSYAKCFNSKVLNESVSASLNIACENFNSYLQLKELRLIGNEGTVDLSEFERFQNLKRLTIQTKTLHFKGSYKFKQLRELSIYKKIKLTSENLIDITYRDLFSLKLSSSHLRHFKLNVASVDLTIHIDRPELNLKSLGKIENLSIYTIENDVDTINLEFEELEYFWLLTKKLKSIKRLSLKGNSLNDKIYLSDLNLSSLEIDVNNIQKLDLRNSKVSNKLKVVSEKLKSIFISDFQGPKNIEVDVNLVDSFSLWGELSCKDISDFSCMSLLVPKVKISSLSIRADIEINDAIFNLMIQRSPERLTFYTAKTLSLEKTYLNNSVKWLNISSEGGTFLGPKFCEGFSGIKYLSLGSQKEGLFDLSLCKVKASLDISTIRAKERSKILLPNSDIAFHSMKFEDVYCDKCDLKFRGPVLFIKNSKGINLSFNNCKIKSIYLDQGIENKSLEGINNCDLSELSDLTVKNSKLEILNLMNKKNILKKVEVVNNSNLNTLELGRSAFLKELVLDGNPIKSLDLKILKNMPALEELFINSTANSFSIKPINRFKPKFLKYIFVRADNANEIEPVNLGIKPNNYIIYLYNVKDRKRMRLFNDRNSIVFW